MGMTEHEARELAHKVFDKLWMDGWLLRIQAYQFLTRRMGLGREIHMSELNVEECNKVIFISERELERLQKALGKPPYQPKPYAWGINHAKLRLEYVSRGSRRRGGLRKTKRREDDEGGLL